MTTIADDLLNDFADSGSEGDNENDVAQHKADLRDSNEDGVSHLGPTGGSMELDGDEEEVDDPTDALPLPAHLDAEDEEETKARVEKMQLHGVSDVRSVAGLMKQLQPVIDVSTTFLSTLPAPSFTRRSSPDHHRYCSTENRAFRPTPPSPRRRPHRRRPRVPSPHPE